MSDLEALVIARRLRVPVDAPAGAAPGWGEAAARQLDAALLTVGFTCSPALLGRLSQLPGEAVLDLGVRVLAAVRTLAKRPRPPQRLLRRLPRERARHPGVLG
ncbi:hypothetical protein ACFSTC_09260 [Nonomuraea ferruginea]